MTEYKTVAELLEKPERWTQGANARDKSGIRVPPTDESAMCWCLAGAMQRIYDAESYFSIREKVRIIAGAGFISVFNDTHTHAEVLEVVRKAGI